MPFLVGEDFRNFLLAEPESGMGYQCVRRVDEAGRFVILNAELGLNADEEYEVGLQEIKKLEELKISDERVRDVSMVSEPSSPFYTESLTTMERDGTEYVVEIQGSYTSRSRPGEVFIRYSAFANDRRILPDGSVLPDTYATTESDARMAPSGLAAVGRYALPNPTPAIHRFILVPPQPVSISCGTVASAFGLAGGGVEVCFDQGTPPHTFQNRTTISDR